ncbi:type B 50S ribosomal protein L31 [Streptomyces sp. NPDC007896]|uniref:type B 50S ribosomal protein L31 n=1 Tax=unclassified Streptomyces TaxID=2593676 RepID=UPI0036E712B6
MREGTHPEYGPVVFRDRAANHAFLTGSTLAATAGEKTIEWEDGHTYPVVDVEISNVSHPFYTGNARVLDTAGRVERFERRYGAVGNALGEAGAQAGGKRGGAG